MDCDANEFVICCLKLCAARCPYGHAYASGCGFDVNRSSAVVEVANFANGTTGLKVDRRKAVWLCRCSVEEPHTAKLTAGS